MSLRLRYRVGEEGSADGAEFTGDLVRVGRGADNDLVLSDPSVSRRHCELRRSEKGWTVHDLGSTNGVQLSGSSVRTARVEPGERMTVGIYELWIEGAVPVWVPQPDRLVGGASPPPAGGEAPAGSAVPEAPSGPDVPSGSELPTGAVVTEPLADATLIKPLAELVPASSGATSLLPAGLLRAAARPAERGERPLSALLAFAARLLATETDDEVLDGVLDAAFDALDVDRGFIFLSTDDGRLECALAVYDGRREVRPRGPLPVSETLLAAVVDRRVALVTGDALRDDRLAGGESIRIHQIRSALCAPLWSGERVVVGVLQLDTPFRADAFDERDLELVSALANYTAVAVERLRNARRVDRERRRRAGLERYHSPAVVEEILRRSDGGPEAGGNGQPLRSAEVSVLFADLVGFTGFAEHAAPQEVAELLGAFFDRAVEEIFARGGTLDKFIGDCVMAVFGAPVAQDGHAARAVEAALAIQRRVGEWNAARTAAGRPPMAVRAAINSGPAVAGEIGSETRVDYTVLGDTVNVAARLESDVAAPGEVVIGPHTRRLIADRPLAVEELGARRLSGLSREIAAYRVRRGEGGSPSRG